MNLREIFSYGVYVTVIFGCYRYMKSFVSKKWSLSFKMEFPKDSLKHFEKGHKNLMKRELKTENIFRWTFHLERK